jgi:tRNA (cytidine/uridine-2'-O-)-methyltransferase
VARCHIGQGLHNAFAQQLFRLLCAAGDIHRKAASLAMRIALFQPDIPQNTGTILRLAACLGIEAHIIEPAGFPTSDRSFRRAGMDYLDRVSITRHASWPAFEAWRHARRARLILFTTQASRRYLDHIFQPDDILLFGRESCGVTEAVREAADVSLVIPLQGGLRSLNVAMAAAMAVGEAMRQTAHLPSRTIALSRKVTKPSI